VTQAVRISQVAAIGGLPAVPVASVKLRTEDLLHVLRHDPKKLARVEELLFMNEELKRARKAFEIDEEAATKEQ
jgi:hypothetical protein